MTMGLTTLTPLGAISHIRRRDALGEQIADAVGPANRRGDLLHHALADAVRLVRPGGDVGDNRNARRAAKAAASTIPRNASRAGAIERRMKCAADVKNPEVAGAGFAEGGLQPRNCASRLPEITIWRGVLKLAAKTCSRRMAREHGFRLSRIEPKHGRHAAADRLAHQLAAGLDEFSWSPVSKSNTSAAKSATYSATECPEKIVRHRHRRGGDADSQVRLTA